MIEIWMIIYLEVTIIQHCKFMMPKCYYKERQLILGPHLVLATLHGQFIISIEQDK